jgi:hypothetical protein
MGIFYYPFQPGRTTCWIVGNRDRSCYLCSTAPGLAPSVRCSVVRWVLAWRRPILPLAGPSSRLAGPCGPDRFSRGGLVPPRPAGVLRLMAGVPPRGARDLEAAAELRPARSVSPAHPSHVAGLRPAYNRFGRLRSCLCGKRTCRRQNAPALRAGALEGAGRELMRLADLAATDFPAS